MRKAKSGDKVKINITGKLEDGKVFATSREPLELKIGEAKIIQGVQNAIIGMTPQQTKTIQVPPEAGFGPYDDDMVQEINRELLPDGVTYEVGRMAELPEATGKPGKVKVVGVSETTVTLDLNHPFAGKELIFDIKLLHIF
ncbi:FKBP-type peptidyl-prolyl cis-trans isomerase [bacterium]|nr:FKBP-type peptidyl-prolyl cis-trans isomerase [bacterium]